MLGTICPDSFFHCILVSPVRVLDGVTTSDDEVVALFWFLRFDHSPGRGRFLLLLMTAHTFNGKR